MKALVWVLVLLVAVFIEAEVIAWCHPVQRWLIRRVAAPLPDQHRDRYTEEWYRECEELPNGPVTRLLWILSLLFRRRSVARALRPQPVTRGGEGLIPIGPVYFTRDYVKRDVDSDKTYPQGRRGVVLREHTLLGRVTHVDLRLPDGEFLLKVPIDYIRTL